MTTCKRILALGGCMLLGAASVVQADTTQSNDVQAQISAMRARIAQLEGQQNDSWLNEKRADEVKSLVRDVLSDADTRASMADGGITAGYNNGFFLASEDGKFLLNIAGQLQVRYTWNAREGKQADDQDKNDGYFSLPRTKLYFDGHIGSPKIGYHLQLAANTNGYLAVATDTPSDDFRVGSGGLVGIEEATVSYELADGLTIWAGRDQTPLVRGEYMDSRNLLMAGRSLFSSVFGMGRPTGIGVHYNVSDAVRTQAMVYDRSSSNIFGESGFGGYGAVARADIKIMGDWDQTNDFSSWSGQGQSLVIGVSGAAGQSDHGIHQGFNYDVTGIVDAVYKNNGLGVYIAGAANSFEYDNSGTGQIYGITAQANYMVIADKLEPFVRYDYIDHHGSSRLNLATVGVNYYLAKHAAKFTADLQYAPRGLSGISSGTLTGGTAGTRSDRSGNRNQVAIRAQFQLLF